MKKCSRCEVSKDLGCFSKTRRSKDGLVSECKDCRSKYHKEYHRKNRERLLKYSAEWRIANKARIREAKAIFYAENREKVLTEQKIYAEANREAICARRRARRKANLEKIRAQEAASKKRNVERVRARNAAYRARVYRTNPFEAMKSRLRARIYLAIRGSGFTKRSSMEKILGCSFESLAKWIERQFYGGMSWDNRGQWHIDHIIPLAVAKNEDELIALCHYSNLRPLWAKDNLRKGAKLTL